MTRLLVVRLGSLGDLVHALPAVAAIRRAHPGVEIDWLVDRVHRPFLDLVPILSSVVELGQRSAAAWLAARHALRMREYDVAIDFQGLIKSAALARLSGAARVVGFERAALRERAATPFYTERVDVPGRGHVIHKNLALAAVLGADADAPLEFPIRTTDSAALETLEATLGPSFALINGGAAWPNKRWPADRFGRLAARLRDRHGLRSVVLWGPGEQELGAEIAAASDGAAVVAPSTGLADLVAIVGAARLVVSGDTGPLHIAAAMRTPIVALFGPTDPARNGPWNPRDESVSRYAACACHYARTCRTPETWCLGAVSEDDVHAAVERRIASLT